LLGLFFAGAGFLGARFLAVVDAAVGEGLWWIWLMRR
jgi:hypothetical protein